MAVGEEHQPKRRSPLAALGTTAAIVVLIVGLLVVGLRTFGRPAGDPVTNELIRHELRTDLLLMGAAVRLWLEVEAPEILPVEDKVLYEVANPVVDGLVESYDEANEAREDAIVAKLLERPVSVVILGGGHDLSDNVERLDAECVRVATHEYLRLAQ